MPDLADLLSLNFKDLQDASPELRDRELGQIPDFFANVGSELLIREDAGQPGTLIHQLRLVHFTSCIQDCYRVQFAIFQSRDSHESISLCFAAHDALMMFSITQLHSRKRHLRVTSQIGV